MSSRRRDNPFSLFAFQDIITGLCGIMVFIVLVQVVEMALCGGPPGRRGATADSEQNGSLRREIAGLERELERLKAKSARAVVAAGDKPDPEEAERLGRELSERERQAAALVTQVADLETQVALAKDADAKDAAKIREMERVRRTLERQIAAMKNGRGVTLIAERGGLKIPVYMVCSGSGIEIHRPFEDFPKESIAADGLRSGLIRFLERLDHTTHLVVLLVRPSGVDPMCQAVDVLGKQNFSYGRDPLEENAEISFAVKGAE